MGEANGEGECPSTDSRHCGWWGNRPVSPQVAWSKLLSERFTKLVSHLLWESPKEWIFPNLSLSSGRDLAAWLSFPLIEPELAFSLDRKHCRGVWSRDCDKEDFTGGSTGTAKVCSRLRAKKRLLRPTAPLLALTSLHMHGCVAVCRHGLQAATQTCMHVHAKAQTDACGHMRAQAHVHKLTNFFHRCAPLLTDLRFCVLAERKGKALCSRHSKLTKVNRGQLWLLSGLRTKVLYLLKQLEGEEVLVKGQKDAYSILLLLKTSNSWRLQ